MLSVPFPVKIVLISARSFFNQGDKQDAFLLLSLKWVAGSFRILGLMRPDVPVRSLALEAMWEISLR